MVGGNQARSYLPKIMSFYHLLCPFAFDTFLDTQSFQVLHAPHRATRHAGSAGHPSGGPKHNGFLEKVQQAVEQDA